MKTKDKPVEHGTFETRKDGHYCHSGEHRHGSNGYELKGGRYYLSSGRASYLAEAESKARAAKWLIDVAQQAALPVKEASGKMFDHFWICALADIEAPAETRNEFSYDHDQDGRLFITRGKAASRCMGCDAKFPTKEEMSQHIIGCEKHPAGKHIKELEKRIRELATPAK